MQGKLRDTDTLHRFLFEKSHLRGELVQLDESWQSVLARCEYPEPLKKLLGDALAAAALLSATIKFDGRLTVQAQGDGVVSLLLVQCNSKNHIRGLVNWDGDVEDGDLTALFGKGHLAITIEPENEGERYQGIVDLDGNSLADAVEQYFMNSEQIDTRIWLGSDDTTAAGLMIQKVPGEEEDPDIWDRITNLSDTITTEELTSLDVREILGRLYSQEDIRLFEPETMEFRCNCSRDKLENVLNSIGSEDVYKLLEEKGTIEINCEYCGKKYEFDKVDVGAIFSGGDCHKAPETKQ